MVLISVTPEQKAYLDAKKIHPRQSYAEVLESELAINGHKSAF